MWGVVLCLLARACPHVHDNPLSVARILEASLSVKGPMQAQEYANDGAQYKSQLYSQCRYPTQKTCMLLNLPGYPMQVTISPTAGDCPDGMKK